MKDPFIIFWAVMLFASIVWYAFLVVYIGIKAGRELRTLIRDLSAQVKAADAARK
ncbi:MAG: hypothetical protein JSS11_02115 [Verrucomicrobia bacterium]|nr:hypothetical protein [Verrucomicrobiota bacterium]